VRILTVTGIQAIHSPFQGTPEGGNERGGRNPVASTLPIDLCLPRERIWDKQSGREAKNIPSMEMFTTILQT